MVGWASIAADKESSPKRSAPQEVEMADMSDFTRTPASTPSADAAEAESGGWARKPMESFEIEDPKAAAAPKSSMFSRLKASASSAATDATNWTKSRLDNEGTRTPMLDPKSKAPAELQQDGLTSPLDAKVSSIRANMDMASRTGSAGRSIRSGGIDVQNASSGGMQSLGGALVGHLTGFNPQTAAEGGGAAAEATGNMMMASDSNVKASYKMAQIKNRNAAREADAASEALTKAKADGASPEERSRLVKARFRSLGRRVIANNNLAAHGVVARNMPMQELTPEQTDTVQSHSAKAPEQVGMLGRFGQWLRSFGKKTTKAGDIVRGANATKYIDQGDDAAAAAAGASAVAHQVAGGTQVGRIPSAAIQAKGKLMSWAGQGASAAGDKLAKDADASDLQASMDSGAYRKEAIDKGVYLKGAERKKPQGWLNKAKTWLHDTLFGSSKRKK